MFALEQAVLVARVIHLVRNVDSSTDIVLLSSVNMDYKRTLYNLAGNLVTCHIQADIIMARISPTAYLGEPAICEKEWLSRHHCEV